MLPIDLLVLVAAVAAAALLLVFVFVRHIPNDRVGVVEKRFSSRGAIESGLMALHGEAGFQPSVLRGGLHLLNRVQHAVHVMPLVTIPQGKIGYVFARDGQPLGPTQVLGGHVVADDFQDVVAFLQKGGQRGPQRQILREGTYAINLAQFVVLTEEHLYFLPLARDEGETFRRMAAMIAARDGFRPVTILGTDDLVGIVTVHDGPSLPEGEIIAPVVGDDPADPDSYHNKFQDPERFLAAGGMRGRQLQVLCDGTYYVNRLFATVDGIPKTVVEVGHVGVVISYTGHASGDLSGAAYKHGEMVQRGSRGVWSAALLPGKYAFNTYAGKIVMVPTTNIILKWTRGQVGSHRYDENLAEVTLITKDAFEPNLPLSVVLHIDYRKASLVIQRFGDIKRLVEQTLDPMVSAYFKNIGQTRTLIQLIQERSDIQRQAADEMRAKFGHYDLELEEVLIGTPTSSQDSNEIEQILHQLRARQIAQEQVETYGRQERAAVKERELREAEARAAQQQTITESEISITVQGNRGRAELEYARQQAEQMRAVAQAEADRTRLHAAGEATRIRQVGEAEADRVARVGVAEAVAVEEQVRAYGGPRFQLTQQVMSRFAEAIEHAGVDVVPRIVMGGTGSGQPGGTGSAMEALLALLLSDKITGDPVAAAREPDASVAELRSRLRRQLLPAGSGSTADGGELATR